MEHSWDEHWEKEYSKWIKNVFNAHFFKNYNLKTDCADAAYAARWIFSRIHKLPAGAQLAGSGQLITQATVKPSWKNLSTHENWWQDDLFLTALEYVMNNTYTHSLNNDSYPIKVDYRSFQPGTIYLTLTSHSGHTRQVYRFTENQSIVLLWSNLPRIIRVLDESYFRPSSQPDYLQGGLLQHRWVYQDSDHQWKMKAKASMPHYSTEQYERSFMNGYSYFYEAVKSRVFDRDPGEELSDLKEAIELLNHHLTIRTQLVKEGFVFCQSNNCEEGSANYDNWSTPSRDAIIEDLFDQAASLISRSQNEETLNYWSEIKNTTQYQVLEEGLISLNLISQIWERKHYQSDPNQPIAKRWGLQTWDNFEIQTSSPYNYNENQHWMMYLPPNNGFKVHFEYFDVENGYDYLYLKSTDGTSLSQMTGSTLKSSEWMTPQSIVIFHFQSDGVVNKRGFKVKSVELK